SSGDRPCRPYPRRRRDERYRSGDGSVNAHHEKRDRFIDARQQRHKRDEPASERGENDTPRYELRDEILRARAEGVAPLGHRGERLNQCPDSRDYLAENRPKELENRGECFLPLSAFRPIRHRIRGVDEDIEAASRRSGGGENSRQRPSDVLKDAPELTGRGHRIGEPALRRAVVRDLRQPLAEPCSDIAYSRTDLDIKCRG